MKLLADAMISRSWLAGFRKLLRPTSFRSLPAMRLALIAGVAIGLLFSGAYFGGASAQQRVAIDSGADLQTLYATPEDIVQGKLLAEQSCASCHGANGISQTPAVPHLAGQRSAYLFNELKGFQAGARGETPMNNEVKFLSDDALLKVSAYYASLDPPQAAAANPATVAVDPVQAGKTAAAACAGCHGKSGVSTTPGTPSLAGLDPKYTAAAMKAYKSGQRQSELMKSMLASVADPAIDEIALYYALQKPARSKAPAAGDKAAGATAAAGCAGCHGSDGVSANPAFPSLAGQDAGYLANALAAYKQGTRKDETMKGLAAGLDDAAIKNLAAFFTSQEPKQPDVRKPLTADEWAQKCDRCHGINGNSSDPRLPALAAQRADYLEKMLNDYRDGAHKNSSMAPMTRDLTDQDISGLAAHYAHKTARSVVFVILPSK